MADLIDREELVQQIKVVSNCHRLGEISKSDMEAEDIVQLIVDSAPVEAVPKCAYEQLKWERDIAVSQLNDYGVQFGEQADCVRVVRCRDCEYAHINRFTKHSRFVHCIFHGMSKQQDDFCSYGERRGD